MHTFFQETKKAHATCSGLAIVIWSRNMTKYMYENIFSDILHMQFILSEIDAKFLHRNVMNIKAKGCFRNYTTYKMSNYNDNQLSHYG